MKDNYPTVSTKKHREARELSDKGTRVPRWALSSSPGHHEASTGRPDQSWEEEATTMEN